MPSSRLLVLGDAFVELVKTFLPEGSDATVIRTAFDRRFDDETWKGRWIYVVPLSDTMGERSEGGTRAADPIDFQYGIALTERIPTELRTWPEKDAWVDGMVDLMTLIRDRFQNMRADPLVAAANLYPLSTDDRSAWDQDLLTQASIFFSAFTTTVREVG